MQDTDGHAVEKVFPKAPVRHGLHQIAMGCSNYAHIHPHVLTGSDRIYSAFLQDPQQAYLCIWR